MQSKKPGVHLQLALESRKRFDRLAEDLPVDIEYRKSGGMVVIETDAERAAMETFVARQRESGADVTLLDPDAAREREPHLAETIRGATWSPLDGQVNPLALTQGLALGAKRNGAAILSHTPVKDLEVKGHRIVSVETDKGRFRADTVVNAAGVYASTIGRMAGLEIPIRPRRGQILVTGPAPPLISCCMLSATYIAAKFDPALVQGGGESVSMEQTESGNLLLGSTREFVGYDRRTTLRGIRGIAERTARIVPGLRDVQIIRAFAGLRPYTPDGLPILGRVDALDNFIMAAGHEGDGIALSPVTGDLIAQLIVDGRTAIPLDAFRLERFSSEPEAA
jgi:sarcosine oxidase subunit beta